MRVFKTALKAAISLGLFSYLVWIADPHQVISVLGSVYSGGRLVYIFLAVCAGMLSIVFLSYRWKLILSHFGKDFSLHRLYGVYLMGMFFNNFLPTGIGGDIVRIYRVTDYGLDRTRAFSSVVIERLLGIASTLFLSIIALYFVSYYYKDTDVLFLAVALLLLIFAFFFLITRNRPFKFLLRLFEKVTLLHIGERINKLIEAVHLLKTRRRIIFYVFGLSVLNQSSIVLMNLALVHAFGLQVDLLYLFLAIPLTFILTMLPSINGVGFRDGGFVFLLGKVGISKAAAISMSFMNVIIPMFLSIAGGIMFFMQRKQNREKEIEAIEENL